jgi:hypothetical protein
LDRLRNERATVIYFAPSIYATSGLSFECSIRNITETGKADRYNFAEFRCLSEPQ